MRRTGDLTPGRRDSGRGSNTTTPSISPAPSRLEGERYGRGESDLPPTGTGMGTYLRESETTKRGGESSSQSGLEKRSRPPIPQIQNGIEMAREATNR